MTTQAQRDEIRRQAIARVEKSMRAYELATVTAEMNGETWPVKIKVRADEFFQISGRSTGFNAYITETNAGYLVAVENHNRCGHVPAGCNRYDVQDYIGMENEADAATLTAAINYIIDAGLVKPHPAQPS